MTHPMLDDAIPPPAAQMMQMADLARRLADQSIVIAENAAKLHKAGQRDEAFKALGRSIGYSEAAAQVLLLVKHL